MLFLHLPDLLGLGEQPGEGQGEQGQHRPRRRHGQGRGKKGRAGAAALAAAEAALLLSGELQRENAYFIGKDGAVQKKSIESVGLKKVLVISFATGGSYSAVVLGK